ncbi:hypothetical protein [Calderihabitans maritimus]|uniref:Uncharacterized protein n=1 Tax=Calderihabitans maritimus TaxID=1246530 RepID=A0A1Z5HP38_9FIRM|nr:hypothetical protein [Calderihabitans maritimus]GAW91296.1 hypothetical protein KKC1_04580 [Calderihabitans maritimus]
MNKTLFNGENKDELKLRFSSDYSLFRGDTQQELIILDRPIDELTKNYVLLRNISNAKIGEKIKLYIYANIKESIENSRFFEGYLNDVKLKKKQPIAVFALFNNELQPLLYDKDSEEEVKFYEVDLGETFLITPELILTKPGTLRIIIVSYPYAYPELLLGSYKITNWSTPLLSEEVAIQVKEQ